MKTPPPTAGKLTVQLDGRVVPKKRPRFSGHAYLPQNYRDWQEQAIAQLVQQTDGILPIERCSIEIRFCGRGFRGDLDNLAGAVLDALVQSGLIVDDSIKHIDGLTVQHCPDKGQPIAVITLCPKVSPKKPKRGV